MALYTTVSTPTSLSTAAITVSAVNTATGYNGSWSDISIGDSAKSKLHVMGDATIDGNLTIKGKSIAEALERIEARLNILTPNHELESQWEELKLLGEQYRKMEQDMLEQLETVKRLSKKY